MLYILKVNHQQPRLAYPVKQPLKVDAEIRIFKEKKYAHRGRDTLSHTASNPIKTQN